MRRLHDKRAQLETAWATGVDTPRTVFLDGEADLERAVEVPYPGVLKPVSSLAFKRRFFRPVLDVDGPDDVRRLWPEIADLGTIMLQERVPGGDDELWTVGSYLDRDSRAARPLHRAQAAPAPTRRRLVPGGRGGLGREPRPGGGATAHRPCATGA